MNVDLDPSTMVVDKTRDKKKGTKRNASKVQQPNIKVDILSMNQQLSEEAKQKDLSSERASPRGGNNSEYGTELHKPAKAKIQGTKSPKKEYIELEDYAPPSEKSKATKNKKTKKRQYEETTISPRDQNQSAAISGSDDSID